MPGTGARTMPHRSLSFITETNRDACLLCGREIYIFSPLASTFIPE